MTEWPPADMPGLHIRMQARPPVADYRCRCGWTDAATGNGIPALHTRITTHRTTCTRREDTT